MTYEAFKNKTEFLSERDRISIQILSNFIDWFAPDSETAKKMNYVLYDLVEKANLYEKGKNGKKESNTAR